MDRFWIGIEIRDKEHKQWEGSRSFADIDDAFDFLEGQWNSHRAEDPLDDD